MQHFVIDASVAIKWVFVEPLHNEARRILEEGHLLGAPDFLMLECANVCWVKMRRGDIGGDEALRVLTLIRRGIDRFYPLVGLVDRATKIAAEINHPVYDCLYLATAIENQSKLITADRKFFQQVSQTDYQNSMQLLGF
ncbi:MAG: PIN domain-containing protein [bacterium]|nr:PIN domain-containing protein [bacterium]